MQTKNISSGRWTFLSAIGLALTVAVPVMAQDGSAGAGDDVAGESSTGDVQTSEPADSAGAPEENTEVNRVDADGYADIGLRLDERIKAVSHKVFVREGRFELAPMLGVSVNDAFYMRTMVGGRASWHIWEHLSLEGGFNINLYPIPLQSVRGNFTQPGIDDEFVLYGLADVGVNFAPFYGKFAAMSEWAVHFDTFVTVGLAGMLDGSGKNFWSHDQGELPGETGVFMDEHPWITGARTGDPVPVYNPSPVPALQVGIGGRIFLTKWLALRAEIKNYLYPRLGGPLIPRRTSQFPIQHFSMAHIGLGFYLPTDFDYEYEGARVVEK